MSEDRKVSAGQHRYYRSVVLPLLREFCGYESDALMHAAIKAGFYQRDPRGALPSMSTMTSDEASRFLDFAVRTAAELGLVLPDAERKPTRRSLDAPPDTEPDTH